MNTYVYIIQWCFPKDSWRKAQEDYFSGRGLKNGIALNEISRTHQKIYLLLISVQMSYDTKQKFWKHPKEKFASLQISPKSGWSWQRRLKWNLAISLRRSLGEPDCSLPPNWGMCRPPFLCWGEMLTPPTPPAPCHIHMLNLNPHTSEPDCIWR